MKLYDLVRDEDVSGVSGTGRVAEVCEFGNGWAVVSWPGDQSGVANVIVYADIAHVERIHGHDGRTRLVARD